LKLLSKTPNAADVCISGLDKALRRKNGEELPIITPFMQLNNILGGGFWPGTLQVLIASPAAGKTQMAIQMLKYAAKHGHPSVCVSLEVEAEQMGLRSMSSQTGTSWSKMYTGKCTTGEIERSRRYIEDSMRGLPLWIVQNDADKMGTKEIADMIDDVESMAGQKTPGLIVVDYLHLLHGGDAESVKDAVSRNTRRIKQLVKGRNVAVILISSAGRSKTITEGNEPDLQKLLEAGKESGDIEYNVDAQLVICKIVEKESERERTALAVPKNRCGSTGWFFVPFDNGVFREL
jgi:replicative DNA helicase